MGGHERLIIGWAGMACAIIDAISIGEEAKTKAQVEAVLMSLAEACNLAVYPPYLSCSH